MKISLFLFNSVINIYVIVIEVSFFLLNLLFFEIISSVKLFILYSSFFIIFISFIESFVIIKEDFNADIIL